MDTKELLKKVRKIEIKTRRLSDNVFGGEYQSTFKGRGMTFSEVRQYQYGDDVRSIDWNVTARYNEPYVKIFEEERELTLMLLVDVSGSEFFGTSTQFKRDFITEIAATLSFSALQNNDKVGLILFSNQIELFIPPKKGRSHILRIIRELLEFTPLNNATNISVPLEFISSILKKKAIVFLLSDFLDDKYERNLRITSNKHDLTGIRVFDKSEESIINLGFVSMFDIETGKNRFINTSSKKTRSAFSSYFYEKQSEFLNVFKMNGAGTINCCVDESYVKKLLAYFKARA